MKKLPIGQSIKLYDGRELRPVFGRKYPTWITSNGMGVQALIETRENAAPILHVLVHNKHTTPSRRDVMAVKAAFYEADDIIVEILPETDNDNSRYSCHIVDIPREFVIARRSVVRE